MGYSSLVDYVKISPNSTNPRKKKISKIAIHHMAGNLSVESCGNVFASKSQQASANYGVDSNGRVGCYVDENNRSWATSSPELDHEAVTIEVANDVYGGDWHVSDTALEKCIELCIDTCLRNDIPQLNFTGDKTGNLHMHRWYANTSCPGPYLGSKFPYIAERVNLGLAEKRGELTMTQYEELKSTLQQINARLDKIEQTMHPVTDYAGIKYAYIDGFMPEYARDAVTKLVKANVLQDGTLNLSDSDLKQICILEDANILGNCVCYNTLDDVPEWGRGVCEGLYKAGILKGTGTSLGITEQTVKLLVYLDRMNLLTV